MLGVQFCPKVTKRFRDKEGRDKDRYAFSIVLYELTTQYLLARSNRTQFLSPKSFTRVCEAQVLYLK